MSATMTMNRVIHDAVRRDFGRLVSALGQVRDADAQRAQELGRAFRNLRDQLSHHHRGEDQWIWPMLAKVGVDQHLLTTMESEHQAMSDGLAESSAAMDAYVASGSAADAASARASLLRTQSVVVQHLSHEEEELEPALLPHVETPEWKAVEKKLSRQPPAVAGTFFAWVTDGMTDEGRTYLRSTVPPPVVFVLTRVFGRRYSKEIAPVWR